MVFSNLGEIKSFGVPNYVLNAGVPNALHQGDQEQRGFMDVLSGDLKLFGHQTDRVLSYPPLNAKLLRHPGLNHRVKLGDWLLPFGFCHMDGTYKAWSNSVYYWNNLYLCLATFGCIRWAINFFARGYHTGSQNALPVFVGLGTSRFDTTSELRASSTVRLLLRSTNWATTIEGSNDRKNWKQLDSRSGSGISRIWVK